jgi:MoaA/NifB/PqqE/SkfB family radical SAM enzyme
VRGENVFPVTMELDVSSACNHKCFWCVDPPGSHEGVFMQVPIARRIMEEAKALGVLGIVFKGGGESTLHPHLAKILEIADSLGFEVGLITHGGNLNSELIDSIVKYCDYVRISVDGPTPEDRKEIHGVNDLFSVIQGVKSMLNRRGSKRHPVIGLTFCLDYSRCNLIYNCLQLGEEIKPDYVLIRPPFYEEVGFPSPYTPEEAATLRAKMRDICEGYSGSFAVMVGNWIGDRELEKEGQNIKQDLARRDIVISERKYNGIEHYTRRCPASSLVCVVTANGEVYGCCCLRDIKEFSFGYIDYNANKDFKYVMTGSQRKESLNKMNKVECLKYCTHPLSKPNEIIEYLSQPEKYHSSFL